MLFILFYFVMCKKNTEMDICNQNSGKFINGKHYIPSNFLNEDQKLNYVSWFKSIIYKENENCHVNPPKKKLGEYIEEQEAVIDINR